MILQSGYIVHHTVFSKDIVFYNPIESTVVFKLEIGKTSPKQRKA